MRAVLIAVVFAIGLLSQDAPTVVISGEVTGASGKHTVYVGLWDRTSFLMQPVRSLRFDAGRAARFTFTVPKGRWAISAFEDRNENGVLDMGLFGPKEPNGFYRAFHGHHKPRFDEVALDVEQDLPVANIALN
jgi:uncharacterized protein (DUF2141 family)